MEQINIKVKALNPIIKSKIDLIINDISKIEEAQSCLIDGGDLYCFTFIVTANADSNASALTDQIKALLKSYGSTVMSLTKN